MKNKTNDEKKNLVSLNKKKKIQMIDIREKST